MAQAKVAENPTKTNYHPQTEIDRETAKAIIDAAADRMTFLLETFFSGPIVEPRGTHPDLLEGLFFVFVETVYSLEDLYFLLYPEEKPKWKHVPEKWTGVPPGWVEADLFCDLIVPIRALNFIIETSLTRIDDYEKISERGFC